VNFTVTILGSGAALPTLNRMPSSQYINCNNRHFLIDCAEGTQVQLRKYKVHFQKISHIFISHLHGDHYFGLVGLLSSMSLLGREKEMHLFGPPELEEIITTQLQYGGSRLSFNINFHSLRFDVKEKIHEDDVLEVFSFPLKHKVPTCGFLINEKPKLLKIDTEKLKDKNIEVEHYKVFQNGQDVKLENGTTYRYLDYTFPPHPPMSYAYCSDTKKDLNVPEFIKDCTVLYHEATFLKKDKSIANSTMHSTTIDAANIASLANVKSLYVGHLSSRYRSDEQHLSELKEVFKNSSVAYDGLIIDLSKQ
jgi:ribonuclease Z